jgi:putative transposase
VVSKAYKFRFYPNSAQKKQLAQDFGCARHVWNHALERRTRAYQERGERLTGVDISREITSLKQGERPWLGEANSTVLTQVLRDQDHAFQSFFEGRAKYPKFKKKHAAQSVRYQLDQRQVHRTFSASDHRLVLPKLGTLKLRWSREVEGVPKMVTVRRDACGRYFVSFSCEAVGASLPLTCVEIQPLPEKTNLIGVDFGIKDVVVTSAGHKSGNTRHKRSGKGISSGRSGAWSESGKDPIDIEGNGFGWLACTPALLTHAKISCTKRVVS